MKIFVITFILFSIGCSTFKKQPVPLDLKHWDSKAVIKDLMNDKTHTVDIEVFKNGEQMLRLEISALMGVSVASVVINQQEIGYSLNRQSQFFQGKVNEDSFQYLMNIPLHPFALIAAIEHRNLKQYGWQCSIQNGVIEQCLYPKQNLTVKYLKIDHIKSKVQIYGPQFEMNWLLSRSTTEVQNMTELFRIKAPEGFKIIQIN